MALKFYREYCLKFYLNARHYIIIDGKKGDIHPHTWEFAMIIRFGRGDFVQFNTFEKGIEQYLAPFQNKVLNDMKPFDIIVPTIENVADYFAKDFYEIIKNIGGIFVSLEASETPTRSYRLNLEEQQEFAERSDRTEDEMLGEVVDTVLDNILN